MSDQRLHHAAAIAADSPDPVLRATGNLLAAVADEPWCCETCKYDPCNENTIVLAALALADGILTPAAAS